MRKICNKMFLLVISILTVCFCISCAGIADWTSVRLSGDYAIVRSNTESTELCLMDEDMMIGTPVAGKIVTKVACNEDYILAKCRQPVETITEWRNYFTRAYYIVDVKSKEAAGPYKKSDFEAACEDMGIPGLDWQSVNSLERVDL